MVRFLIVFVERGLNACERHCRLPHDKQWTGGLDGLTGLMGYNKKRVPAVVSGENY